VAPVITQRLRDRSVLVTGAGTGFGAEIAVRAAQEGARVGVHYNRSKDGAERTIGRIQEAVCERFSLTVQELVSPRRSQAVAYPRQVAMYLSRELTDASLPKIGTEFGGRDHTTVMHANAKITRMIKEDRAVYNLVQDLTARIKHRG
jgi:chromosomal replication initiation ATPase DnaA